METIKPVKLIEKRNVFFIAYHFIFLVLLIAFNGPNTFSGVLQCWPSFKRNDFTMES